MQDNLTTSPSTHALTATVYTPPPAMSGHLSTGTTRNPDGREITVDSRSLLRGGKPWLPVMGEFHFSRYPQAEWRDELLKMKMGGIDIVATYVFWIHHEEIEGKFDWSGRRNLHNFITLCGELDLYSVIRLGPWCHGECRNGGLPDWLLAKGIETRSDDPQYLRFTTCLYREIAKQMDGHLWKQGGPVIGAQLENEYNGPAQHLISLKRIAIECGINVPLYTRTGWPDLSTPMPIGEILPLFGGYPDGFWDRSLDEMPPGYAENFMFRMVRNDAAVATDQLGVREVKEEQENAHYPYFACEIGGGMMPGYHRRIRILPGNIEALALAKVGSGTNLPGYYMYHGGTNPPGLLTTLQESQATGYWNDLPVKTYDFQAPLGEFGEVREHYHELRRMHLFLRDFGHTLATMPTTLPEIMPRGASDTSTLRWSVRSDGSSGFVFVSNYQRLQPMPAKTGIQFRIPTNGKDLVFPADPITVPADTCFFWPFHLDLAGAHLVYATAQPICHVTDGDTTYFVFAQTINDTEFVFGSATAELECAAGSVAAAHGQISVRGLKTGTDAAIRLRGRDGKRIAIILLDHDQSLTCWKATLQGRERIFLTAAALRIDGDTIRLESENASDLGVSVLPPLPLTINGHTLPRTPDGVFERVHIETQQLPEVAVERYKVRQAGPARDVSIGSQGVAQPPADDAFDNAEIWRIHLPQIADTPRNLHLRISYAGDIARVYLDGELLTDNFYNGNVFNVGLQRYAPGIYHGDLLLKILPLAENAPIYMQAEAQAAMSASKGENLLQGIEIVERHTVTLEIASEHAPHQERILVMAAECIEIALATRRLKRPGD